MCLGCISHHSHNHVIPILQMKKPKHKAVKQFNHRSQVINGKDWIQIQVVGLQSLCYLASRMRLCK